MSKRDLNVKQFDVHEELSNCHCLKDCHNEREKDEPAIYGYARMGVRGQTAHKYATDTCGGHCNTPNCQNLSGNIIYIKKYINYSTYDCCYP